MRITCSRTTFLMPLLFSSVVVLASLSGVFYHHRKSFENENRRLIIQNDSIMSVNIELKNSLQGKTILPFNTIVNQNNKAGKKS